VSSKKIAVGDLVATISAAWGSLSVGGLSEEEVLRERERGLVIMNKEVGSKDSKAILGEREKAQLCKML
jgi:hypothetical protein